AKYVSETAQWHDGAMRERNWLRQSRNAFFQPPKMPRQELICVGETRIARHGKHGAAPRFADLQTEASRSRASFQHHWNVETADFDFDSPPASETEPLKHFSAPSSRPVPPRFGGRYTSTGF